MTDARPLFGLGICLLSALSFASNSTLSVFAYRDGADAVSVGTFRFVVVCLALFVYLKAFGIPMRLPPRQRNWALALGLLAAVQSGCLLTAMQYIDVGLAILTLYLHPLLVGVIVALTGHERTTPALWGCLAVAFVGLTLALDVTGDGFDAVGVGLAAVSATLLSVLIVGSARVIGARDSRPVTFHMHISGALAWIVVGLLSPEFRLPHSAEGWASYVAVPLLYTIAITTFFVAVGVVGPVKTSLVMNIEPLASMTLGFLLLGQIFTGLQLVGAALVVAAIVTLHLAEHRRAR